MTPPRLPQSLLQFCILVALCFNPALLSADPPAQSAAQLREALQQSRQQKQSTDRDLSLKKGAVAVSDQRIQDLQKQLEVAKQRYAAETAEAEKLQQQSAALEKSITAIEAVLPQHEAADVLVAAADRASTRFQALLEARRQLQTQLAQLRKSSVEWRSRASEAEQQLAAIAAQRPELDKKLAEAKTALDGAEAKVTASRTAVEAASAAMKAVATLLGEHETRLTEAKAADERFRKSTASLEKSLTTLQQASVAVGVDSSAAIQGLQKSLADLVPVSAARTALVAELTKMRDDQTARLVAARAEVDAKTAELNTVNAAAEPQRAAHKSAADALATAVARTGELNTVKSDGGTWQTTLNAQLLALEPSLQKLEAELQLAESETLVVRRQAEAALEPLGRFVSFSRHVAPILARRCVACHNTRSPGGRLNLDSFAAMGKGGESGAAFTAGKSHDSLMLSMIRDGSMPKEADQLAAAEIDVLARWIDVGAPLDAGFSATSDLFDVMPEFAQPQPPEQYRTAIPVTAVAFSPDGEQLASSGYHEVLVWNAGDSTLLRRISNLAERIHDIEYSADGTRIAVASGTPGQLGELKLFSTADGKLIRTLVRSRDSIFAVAFSPDGTKVACAGADRSITVVNPETGEQLVRIEDHADWVMDVNWAPNGQRLVSASRDKTCKVFDATTGNPVVTFPGHGEPVYTAAFLSDSNQVVSGGADKRLKVWQSSDAKDLRTIGGFGGDVFRVRVQAGDLLLTASGDGNVHQHKAADGAAVKKFSGHRDWVYAVAEHAGRKRLASGSYDGEVRVWNAEDGSTAAAFPAVPKTQTVAAAGN
ncbi:MAG: c-type cytochrome domain-containing protein [Planctomycetaceae bacterium]